jgi:hypothetical protein
MEETEVCKFCNNTGFVTNLEYDSDVHAYIPAGMIECKHPGLKSYDNN